jgi:hypothetical protein
VASVEKLEILKRNVQMGGANVVGYLEHCLPESGPGWRARSVDVLAIVRLLRLEHPHNDWDAGLQP